MGDGRGLKLGREVISPRAVVAGRTDPDRWIEAALKNYESFQVVGGPPRSLSRWFRASHSSALRTRTTPSGESSILVSTSTQHLMRSTFPSAGKGTVQIRAVPSAEPVGGARPSERKAAE